MYNCSVVLVFNMLCKLDGICWCIIFIVFWFVVVGNGNIDISICMFYGTGCYFCCYFFIYCRILFKRLLVYVEDFYFCLIGESNKVCIVKFGCIFSCIQGAS